MDTAFNLHRLLVGIILLLWTLRSNGQNLDILAFEYTRKFPTLSSLDIGECAYTIEEILPEYAVTKTCKFSTLPGQIANVSDLSGTTLPSLASSSDRPSLLTSGCPNFAVLDLDDWPLNITCNTELQNDLGVFSISPYSLDALCNFGLLYRGDCLAVEIGSNLTFSKKTYIRAYIEYYRHSIDILRSDMSNIPSAIREKYTGNHFVKYMSYGTLEMIIVQVKFRKKQQASFLRKTKFNSLFMSDWLTYIKQDIDIPAETRVIRVSTGNKKLKMMRYKKKFFSQAMTKVQEYESEIRDTRESIKRQYIRPHLQYGFAPYIPGSIGQFRSSQERVSWERVSQLEIAINRALKTQRSIKKNCKKAGLSECAEIKKTNRALRKIKQLVHQKRIKWCELNDSEQQSAIVTNNKQLKKRVREQNKIKKLIQIWKKQQKDIQKSARKKRRLLHIRNRHLKNKRKLMIKKKRLNSATA